MEADVTAPRVSLNDSEIIFSFFAVMDQSASEELISISEL